MERKKNDMNSMKPDYTKYFKINLRIFFRKFKYSRQRIKRGFSDADAWNVDWYLGKLIEDILIHFSEKTQCYPDRSHDSFQEWIENLRWAANTIREVNNYDLTREERQEKLNQFCDWLKENYYDLWD